MLSTPAVSQHIALLERAVGTRLFDREPRKAIGITEGGRLLLRVCENVFQQLGDAMDELERVQRSREGRLTFSASSSFCSYLLPSLCVSFRECEPGIAVHIQKHPRGERVDGLLRGSLDLAILSKLDDDRQLTGVPLVEHDLILVGLPGHRLATSHSAPFREVTKEHLIVTGEVMARHLADLADRNGVELDLAWEEEIATQINAVSSGTGIALVPYYSVATHLAAGTFCLLPLEGFPIRRSWYLAWPSDRLSPTAAAFRDHLLDSRAEVERLSLVPGVLPQTVSFVAKPNVRS